MPLPAPRYTPSGHEDIAVAEDAEPQGQTSSCPGGCGGDCLPRLWSRSTRGRLHAHVPKSAPSIKQNVSTMKIAWGTNAKAKKQPMQSSAKPDHHFESKIAPMNDKDERAQTNPNSPGTEAVDTIESLQRQGRKLATESITDIDIAFIVFCTSM
ncbi:hypothetical protein ACP70R_006906 [Stipagrostis hirtigluma subsp. patula]